ncbi:hypothetical protein DFJ74DRAFT_643036 [Hyaloraphidium curvatum]|nr:hypothetical protein DFJ74DRAFT_643036 [Hyaloraphidium curvatum]
MKRRRRAFPPSLLLPPFLLLLSGIPPASAAAVSLSAAFLVALGGVSPHAEIAACASGNRTAAFAAYDIGTSRLGVAAVSPDGAISAASRPPTDGFRTRPVADRLSPSRLACNPADDAPLWLAGELPGRAQHQVAAALRLRPNLSVENPPATYAFGDTAVFSAQSAVAIAAGPGASRFVLVTTLPASAEDDPLLPGFSQLLRADTADGRTTWTARFQLPLLLPSTATRGLPAAALHYLAPQPGAKPGLGSGVAVVVGRVYTGLPDSPVDPLPRQLPSIPSDLGPSLGGTTDLFALAYHQDDDGRPVGRAQFGSGLADSPLASFVYSDPGGGRYLAVLAAHGNRTAAMVHTLSLPELEHLDAAPLPDPSSADGALAAEGVRAAAASATGTFFLLASGRRIVAYSLYPRIGRVLGELRIDASGFSRGGLVAGGADPGGGEAFYFAAEADGGPGVGKVVARFDGDLGLGSLSASSTPVRTTSVVRTTGTATTTDAASWTWDNARPGTFVPATGTAAATSTTTTAARTSVPSGLAGGMRTRWSAWWMPGLTGLLAMC